MRGRYNRFSHKRKPDNGSPQQQHRGCRSPGISAAIQSARPSQRGCNLYANVFSAIKQSALLNLLPRKLQSASSRGRSDSGARRSVGIFKPARPISDQFAVFALSRGGWNRRGASCVGGDRSCSRRRLAKRSTRKCAMSENRPY
jgi:hypothetical protein